ncbi:hypothetical protein HJC23_008388 [Cyclotella cryptica]|uniref:Uncharacterized protein n=1 Tax=Cyclotella cryptica TaxID=29204 RepID=A0ABD3PK47_9STRA
MMADEWPPAARDGPKLSTPKQPHTRTHRAQNKPKQTHLNPPNPTHEPSSRTAIMSLASVICSRLSCTATYTLSWALPTLQRALPAVQTIQSRSVWQEVVRQVPSEDPQRQGQMTFEDVDVADMRINRATRAEAPLRRRTKFVRHEKGWMRRKRLKMETRYLRLQEGVEQMKAYIKFKQDNKPGR